MTNFRFCPSCGVEVMAGTSFCGTCGAVLAKSHVGAEEPSTPVSAPHPGQSAAPFGQQSANPGRRHKRRTTVWSYF